MALIEGLWPPQGSRKIHIVHVESPSEIFVRDEIMEDKWSQREEDFKRVRFICFYQYLKVSSNFKLSFWCHRLDQNTNEFFSRISALASKKSSNQKNKGTLYH